MPAEIKPEYRQCLGFFEAFRRLGYKPDNIYFSMSGTGNALGISMVLVEEGRQFVCAVGRLEGTREEIEKGWEEASTWWNTTTEADREKNWLNSFVHNNSFSFMAALLAKGFTPANNRLN
jgi:hypothetical protein